MKFFYAKDARQWGLPFVVYDIVGGTAVGVYATQDPAEIAKLDALIASGKPINETTQADYEACLKKKPPGPEGWRPWVMPTPPAQVTAPLKGGGAVVVSEPEPQEEPVAVEVKMETTADALVLGQVAPSEPKEPAPKLEEPKKSKRWKR